MAALVTHREYEHPFRLYAVDNYIRKAPHQQLARIVPGRWPDLRVLSQTREDALDFGDKLLAESWGLVLVKASSTSDIRLRRAKRRNRDQRWSWARISASACAAGIASSCPAR
ncbi:hypothetical protein BH23ACT11_BH23ACT11_15580 [soil metagenome]